MPHRRILCVTIVGRLLGCRGCRLAQARDACHHGGMRTVFEAAGGIDGLRRLAAASALRQVLHDYFAWATTTTMARYHRSANDVPDGLAIPRWSWEGLQE
jgi:hypothetical protein